MSQLIRTIFVLIFFIQLLLYLFPVGWGLLFRLDEESLERHRNLKKKDESETEDAKNAGDAETEENCPESPESSSDEGSLGEEEKEKSEGEEEEEFPDVQV